MKKRLKRYGKQVVIALSITFISLLGYILATTTSQLNTVIAILGIILWVGLIFLVLGIGKRIYEWWEKD